MRTPDGQEESRVGRVPATVPTGRQPDCSGRGTGAAGRQLSREACENESVGCAAQRQPVVRLFKVLVCRCQHAIDSRSWTVQGRQTHHRIEAGHVMFFPGCRRAWLIARRTHSPLDMPPRSAALRCSAPTRGNSILGADGSYENATALNSCHRPAGEGCVAFGLAGFHAWEPTTSASPDCAGRRHPPPREFRR